MAIPFLKSKTTKTAQDDDPLALFEAESGFSMHDDAGSLPDADLRNGSVVTSRPLKLETVLARRTPVLWPEAIAIVEATCAVLRPSNGAELPAPEASHILLTSEGAVQVRTGINLGFGRGDSVPRLARTLHALTSGQGVPAPLRLLITKWNGSDGPHTIAEFAKELGYFARPDGAQLIRDVYMRCLSMPVEKGVEKAVEKVVAPAPAQQRTEVMLPMPTKRRPQVARRGRGVWVVAAAAVVVAIGAASLFFRSQQPGQTDPFELPATLSARTAEVASEVQAGVSDIRADLTGRLGTITGGASSASPGPSVSAPSNQGRGAAPPASNTGASSAARPPLTSPAQAAARSAAPAARPAVAAARAAGAPAAAVSPARVPPAVAPAATPRAEAAPVRTSAAPEPSAPVFAATAAASDPSALYSSADEDVNPPKLLYPQVPPVPVLFATNDDVNVMEIVVADNGSVERVTLVSQPKRLTDMMLLSGAKNWKFAPASRNGQAVRYRIALRWATTQ